MRKNSRPDPIAWVLVFTRRRGFPAYGARSRKHHPGRTRLQRAMAAVLGGTHRSHTNSYDEALRCRGRTAANSPSATSNLSASNRCCEYPSIPPRMVLLTRISHHRNRSDGAQIISGQIEALGCLLKAIERGYVNRYNSERCIQISEAVDNGEAVVVGPSPPLMAEEESHPAATHCRHAGLAEAGRTRAGRAREARLQRSPAEALQAARRSARSGANLMQDPYGLSSVTTVGEISDIDRRVHSRIRRAAVAPKLAPRVIDL